MTHPDRVWRLDRPSWDVTHPDRVWRLDRPSWEGNFLPAPRFQLPYHLPSTIYPLPSTL